MGLKKKKKEFIFSSHLQFISQLPVQCPCLCSSLSQTLPLELCALKLFLPRVAFGYGVLSQQQKVTDTPIHKTFGPWIAAPADYAFLHRFRYILNSLAAWFRDKRTPSSPGFPWSESLGSGLPHSELAVVSSCVLKELLCGTSTLW